MYNKKRNEKEGIKKLNKIDAQAVHKKRALITEK